MRPSNFLLRNPARWLILPGLLFNTAVAQQLAEVDSPALVAQTQEVIDSAVRAQAANDRDAWLRTIADLESREGSWGAELGEAWLGLGATLRTLEQYEEAAKAFGNALQSLRVGYGLTDVRQLPVLEQLRAMHEQTGNWDEVHAANYLIFHIAKHSDDPDLRVRSMLDLGRWIRKASTQSLVNDLDASPGRLTELYGNEIRRLEELATDYDGRKLHLAALNLDLATNELMEAKRKYEMPITEFQSPSAGEQRSYTSQQCVSGIDRNGRPFQYCTMPVEVPNLNYYLAPNVRKTTEIREHLTRVENSVLAAYHTLQNETAASDARTALLSEVQRLTGEYNAFVRINPK